MKCLSYVFLNFTVAIAFRIEVNEELYFLCEILVFRPTYMASQSEKSLKQVVTNTGIYSSKVSFIYILTDEPLDMIQTNREFALRALYNDWNNVSLQTYVSRKHTSGDSKTCSISLTTAYHMMTKRPGIIKQEDQYAQLWGSWLRRSLQRTIGLMRFSEMHIIFGVICFNELSILNTISTRDTQYMPPFMS